MYFFVACFNTYETMACQLKCNLFPIAVLSSMERIQSDQDVRLGKFQHCSAGRKVGKKGDELDTKTIILYNRVFESLVQRGHWQKRKTPKTKFHALGSNKTNITRSKEGVQMRNQPVGVVGEE